MAVDDDTGSPANTRIGWRHEWGTLALLWAMVVWVSVTVLGTKGAAASRVTAADVVVVAFVLAGAALATLTIVRAAEIPMLSAPPTGPAPASDDSAAEEVAPAPADEVEADADTSDAEPESEGGEAKSRSDANAEADVAAPDRDDPDLTDASEGGTA